MAESAGDALERATARLSHEIKSALAGITDGAPLALGSRPGSASATLSPERGRGARHSFIR